MNQTPPRPQSKWAPWLLAMGLWIGFPFVNREYLILTQSLGYYPVNADSIGIPVAGGFFLAIVGFPIWLFVCWKAFRRHLRPILHFGYILYLGGCVGRKAAYGHVKRGTF